MIIIQYKKFNIIIIMCTIKRKNVHINQSQFCLIYNKSTTIIFCLFHNKSIKSIYKIFHYYEIFA